MGRCLVSTGGSTLLYYWQASENIENILIDQWKYSYAKIQWKYLIMSNSGTFKNPCWVILQHKKIYAKILWKFGFIRIYKVVQYINIHYPSKNAKPFLNLFNLSWLLFNSQTDNKQQGGVRDSTQRQGGRPKVSILKTLIYGFKPFCNWYFLRGECYKCIVFHKRHVNVLQYKESKRQPFQ